MKKIYVFSYEYDDDNMCIGVIANTKKEAVGLFYHDDIGYEGNNPMKDLTCRVVKDIDVSKMVTGIIDLMWGVKNNIYFSCEGYCEKCDKYATLYESGGKCCCGDCE